VNFPTLITGVGHLPKRGHDTDAGYDLRAALDTKVYLRPRAFATISTGVHICPPNGYEIQIRPRSGLAKQHGITVLNSPGTIDAGYTGEICVILINLGPYTFCIMGGMRIAQLVPAKVAPSSDVLRLPYPR